MVARLRAFAAGPSQRRARQSRKVDRGGRRGPLRRRRRLRARARLASLRKRRRCLNSERDELMAFSDRPVKARESPAHFNMIPRTTWSDTIKLYKTLEPPSRASSPDAGPWFCLRMCEMKVRMCVPSLYDFTRRTVGVPFE